MSTTSAEYWNCAGQRSDAGTAESSSTAHDSSSIGTTVPYAAAGPGYAGEWALFCDYTTATSQPTLPTTVAALTGFLTTLPARPATVARRVRAIAAAHRRAGHLLQRPDIGPAAPPIPPQQLPLLTGPGPMIAACPTRGWPHGLHGRRDAFLTVLTTSLALPYPVARTLTPTAIVTGIADDQLTDCDVDDDTDCLVAIAGQTVAQDVDPRECPACAVVRWLDILGTLDGLGRGSARMDLVTAHAPTADTPHTHRPKSPHRWRDAATLLPAIDQHGWLDDYRPITTRTMRTRMARTSDRAAQPVSEGEPPPGTAGVPFTAPAARQSFGPTAPALDEVLTVLDGVADDVDALNARIQALLNADH
ncbi:hypothetical protein [Pseudonocardia sp. EC080610-09]|uniref:hypothetical protein n=1 Tax=Pseudonocardia sp. EC080610-09 TaxID=1688404 RepID=UPI0011AEA9E6|nr:hypothetical protein [Pseudonocardia sp. EC080610-09]